MIGYVTLGGEGPNAFYGFRGPEGNKLCAYRVGPE